MAWNKIPALGFRWVPATPLSDNIFINKDNSNNNTNNDEYDETRNS